MRKFLLVVACCISVLSVFAQSSSVELKAGTNVLLRSLHQVRAQNLQPNDVIPFKVGHDVVVNGETVIPFGSVVKAKVVTAKRSKWWGTKGRLSFKFDNIQLPTGENVPLEAIPFEVTGKNRTPLSVCLFLFGAWPCCFICGSGAVLPAGYEANVVVSNSTMVPIVNSGK